MSEYVRLTIEELRRRRQKCDEAIRLLLELEDPVFPPMVKMPPELVKPGPVLPKDKPIREKPGPKVSGHGKKPNHHSTKKLLHYKGVKPLKPKEDGTPRFEGHTRVDGKFKYLGTFSVEELAAAAVMEAEGNKAEAERLREIAKQKAADEAEQRENNPDRLPKRLANRDDDSLDKTPQVWECQNEDCYKQYIQTEKPAKCLECGHTEFKPIV